MQKNGFRAAGADCVVGYGVSFKKCGYKSLSRQRYVEQGMSEAVHRKWRLRGRGLTVLVASALIMGSFGPQVVAVAAADLSGVWMTDAPHVALAPASGDKIPLTTAGKNAYEKNVERLRERKDKPVAVNDLSQCLPLGPTRLLEQPYPIQVIQSRKMFVLIYEHNHVYEIAYIGKKPDLDRDPGFMGNSVASMSERGIEITTTGFKEGSMLDDTGLPHSDRLSMKRNIHVNASHDLEFVTTVTDPVMYRKPWTVRQILKSRPDLHIEEYTCGQGPVLETRYTR